MRTKDYLYSIKYESKELDRMNDRIVEAELTLLPSAIRYDADKVQTTPDDPMLRMIAEVDSLKGDLAVRVERLTKRRRKAYDMIDTLEDSRHRQVLQEFFLGSWRTTMEDVAVSMSYSVREVYNLYSQAISLLPKSVQ